ncbi:hypothetical protein ACFQ9Z_16935 [Streptomyces sp. NPDC056580]|uniref:hypothetical protein n=1 Tax=Streptomyces sp. NPDC056580 TaxID=3345872 RepID=UPI0036A5FFDB
MATPLWAAARLAAEVGITDVHAGLLPRGDPLSKCGVIPELEVAVSKSLSAVP